MTYQENRDNDGFALYIFTSTYSGHTAPHHWTVALAPRIPTRENKWNFYHIFSTACGYTLTTEKEPLYAAMVGPALAGPELLDQNKVCWIPSESLGDVEEAIDAAVRQDRTRWIKEFMDTLISWGWVSAAMAKRVRARIPWGHHEPTVRGSVG
ncbi:hypothetical protein BJX99DRAFT_252865 [Aspergillus californicus]